MIMMKIKTTGHSPGSTYDLQEDRHIDKLDDVIKT